MPRSPAQYEAMRMATREKIYSAAIKLFSQKGLSATGVQEIADTAGISVGLLYRHFKTKDDIFGSLVKEALEGLEQVGQLFASDMAPPDAIMMFTNEILHDFSGGDDFSQLMMLLTQPFFMNQDHAWMNDIREKDRYLFGQLAHLIERGQQSGHFKSGDPMQMAQHYFAVIQGICLMKHIIKDEYILPTAEMVTSFIFKGGEL